jgi:hypothetical protein
MRIGLRLAQFAPSQICTFCGSDPWAAALLVAFCITIANNAAAMMLKTVLVYRSIMDVSFRLSSDAAPFLALA